MQGLGDRPKIKIKGYKQKEISLYDYHFENFCYIEDINLGFPTIEFALRDSYYNLLREGLFGDEELIIEEFIQDKFKFIQKSFTIKSIGSLGLKPKPSTLQVVKLVAIDKNYDSILKNQKSIYFSSGERKKISDLLKKLLTQVGIQESTNFKIKIEDTSPLLEQGFSNLYIPYSRDPMKVIRKLTNYAMTPNGIGGFVFFINRRGLNFVPIHQLFTNVIEDTTPKITITDITTDYSINNAKLSTFNAFTNFITGHEKKIAGFNSAEKDYNTVNYKSNAKYIEHSEYENKPEKISDVKTMPIVGMSAKPIPFSKDFITGNIKYYYTPLDNPLALKAFGDKLYYSQMLSYQLELNVNMLNVMPDLAIGEIINIEFNASDKDKWAALNGAWLLKSFSFIYPSSDLTLKLTRIGIGTLPEQYVRVGE